MLRTFVIRILDTPINLSTTEFFGAAPAIPGVSGCFVKFRGSVKAVGFTRFGDPDVLRELDLPDEEAGPGQIWVQVRYSGVNPSDTLRRSGCSRQVACAVELC